MVQNIGWSLIFKTACPINRRGITVNGNGNYEARETAGASADVRINGPGSVTIRVSQSLNVHFGNYYGNVQYLGNLEITQKQDSDSPGEVT